MIAQTLHGPQLKCYVNGKLLGIVTSIEFNVARGFAERSGIDQNTVAEFIPGNVMIAGRISVVRIRGSGGLEGLGLVAFPDKMLLEKYNKIDLIDRSTDKVVFSAINAVITDQSWSVGAKQLMAGSISFRAANYTNEAAG